MNISKIDWSISVIIPTCDRPTFLTAALSSVPAVVNEIIVVNDGVLSLPPEVGKDCRVKIIQTGPRGGPAAARNAGALAASGSILFFLDDDDRFVPDYINRILSVLQSSREILCGFSAVIETIDHNPIRIKKKFGKSKIISSSRPGAIVHAASAGFWINRDIFFQIGAFDECLKVDEDTDLCLRLFNLGARVWYESKPGVQFRIKSGSSCEEEKISEKSVLSDVSYVSYRKTLVKHFRFASASMKFYLINRTIRRGMKDLGYIDDEIFQGLDWNWRLVGRIIKLKYILRRI